MTRNRNSTRYYSRKQEDKVAKELGGKVVSNSGATKWSKGDVILGDYFLGECKTCIEPKKSFAIKKEWLETVEKEKIGEKKPYSTLVFDYGDNKERYYIINESAMKRFIELLEGEKGE